MTLNNSWFVFSLAAVMVLCISMLLPISIELLPRNIKDFLTLSKWTASKRSDIYVQDDLAKYSGADDRPIYLAILGEIFDVSKGRAHYGLDGSYNVFAGRDASRLFITGEFTNLENADAVLDLSCSELLPLLGWRKKYHTDYVYKGKLIGRYYDENGQSTKYKTALDSQIEQCKHFQNTEDQEKSKYPPCNMEWDQTTGTKVWCSNKSGGINRDWIGVPRQAFMPQSDQTTCVCVKDHTLDEKFKEYDNCASDSSVCYIGTKSSD